MDSTWEEDPVRGGLWWLMRRQSPSYSSAVACISLVNGSIHGFIVGDDPGCDEDSWANSQEFKSLEEARAVLEVIARLGGH